MNLKLLKWPIREIIQPLKITTYMVYSLVGYNKKKHPHSGVVSRISNPSPQPLKNIILPTPLIILLEIPKVLGKIMTISSDK